MLDSLGVERLRGIAKVMKPKAYLRINQLGKDRLINFINYQYDKYQAQSRDFIYNETMKIKYDNEWIKESTSEPGIEEISK